MSVHNVVVLRGTAANPWDLRPWEALHASGRADVSVVVPPDNNYDVASIALAWSSNSGPAISASELKNDPMLNGRVRL